MSELKPCPFCGAKAFVWRTSNMTYVQCEEYVSSTHKVEVSAQSDKEAFRLWNQRKGEHE